MYWNVEAYRETVFRRLNLPILGSEDVLDIGCGDGGDALWFSGRVNHTVAVDIVEHPNWCGIRRPGLSFMRADGESLTLASQSFDIIFVKDVLHHARCPESILAQAIRLCRPTGLVCVVEANRYHPVSYVHMTRMLGHEHLTRTAFKRLVRSFSPQARFIQFETHVYPFKNYWLLGAARCVENVVSLPLMRAMASYNAAIIKTNPLNGDHSD